MEPVSNMDPKRPLIIVGPDGQILQLPAGNLVTDQWELNEAGDTVMLITHLYTRRSAAETMDKICNYVDANLSRKIMLRDVADHCGISTSSVTQLFRKKMETSFHQYLTQRRLLAAECLIQAGVPLEEISKRVGFTNYSSFYRAFKQTYGVSPRKFPKNGQPGHPGSHSRKW